MKGDTRFRPLFLFAEKLFNKKIGESVSIPFSKIEPLMSGQQGGYRDVTRRVFRAYLAAQLGKCQKDIDKGKPSIMYQLCDFDQEDFAVKVTKKMELKNFR